MSLFLLSKCLSKCSLLRFKLYLYFLKSMGLWAKAKGFFSRIGNGIKNGAKKVYNWITDNKDKIQKGVDLFNKVTNDKYSNMTDKGMSYMNKGMDMANKLGIG